MKSKYLKTLFSSSILLGAILAIPMYAYAANGSASTSVNIRDDSFVRILGAEVTSVSGNIINAITRFRTTAINWAFTTNASTTIAASNSLNASSTAVRTGDRIDVLGSLNTVGTTFGVTASKILDTTSVSASGTWRLKSGIIQSINTGAGSFVMKSDKTITVQTGPSTQFLLGKTTSTFSSLAVSSRVYVFGVLTTDGTRMTASTVSTNLGSGMMGMMKINNGMWNGLKYGWRNNKETFNSELHYDFMKNMMGWDGSDNR